MRLWEIHSARRRKKKSGKTMYFGGPCYAFYDYFGRALGLETKNGNFPLCEAPEKLGGGKPAMLHINEIRDEFFAENANPSWYVLWWAFLSYAGQGKTNN
jgi:hypothetical protein